MSTLSHCKSYLGTGHLHKEDTVYIAGPMTGIPQFNIPAFDAARDDLEERDLQPISPGDLDLPGVRAAALASPDGLGKTGYTWGVYLSRDIKIVVDEVDAVTVLPGWERSLGARGETYFAFLAHKPIVYYPSLELVPAHILEQAWLGRLIP